MTGNDAVVTIGRRDQRRRIADPGFDVVKRRVRQQVFDLVRFVAATELGHPSPADREFLVAQHVHHADGRQTCAEQFRTLRHDRADEQPAVAAAANSQPTRRRVAPVDQMLGGGDEVVEHVLLFQSHSGFVPLAAVFATAS